MATVEHSAVTQEQQDREEVARLVSQGRRVTDPELRRRITERGDAARRVMLERHGVRDIAVELLRKARDDAPRLLRQSPSINGDEPVQSLASATQQNSTGSVRFATRAKWNLKTKAAHFALPRKPDKMSDGATHALAALG